MHRAPRLTARENSPRRVICGDLETCGNTASIKLAARQESGHLRTASAMAVNCGASRLGVTARQTTDTHTHPHTRIRTDRTGDQAGGRCQACRACLHRAHARQAQRRKHIRDSGRGHPTRSAGRQAKAGRFAGAHAAAGVGDAAADDAGVGERQGVRDVGRGRGNDAIIMCRQPP